MNKRHRRPEETARAGTRNGHPVTVGDVAKTILHRLGKRQPK
jgi:hypothetical protein